MRSSKAMIAAFFMALLCSIVIVSDDSDATVEIQQGDLIFILNDDYTAEVSDYLGDGGDIIIPSSVTYNGRTYSVTSIGTFAFRSSSVTGAVIPDSVRLIDRYAFFDCDRLVSVTLNEGLETIEYRAFGSCDDLVSIHIPSTVSYIGGSAIGSHDLSSITVSPSNLYFKSVDDVLFSKDGTRLIAYPGMKDDVVYRIPSEVRDVDDAAFYSNFILEELYFNEGLTTLTHPVDNCLLTTVHLPSTLETIDRGLVDGAVDTIILSAGNSHFVMVDGILYDSSMETVIEITVDAGTVIEIPEGVMTLGMYSADWLTLDGIDLPSTVSTIRSSAFEFTEITQITIPASVRTLESSVFWSSTLEDVTFMGVPDQIKSYAFYVRSPVLTERYAVEPIPLED